MNKNNHIAAAYRALSKDNNKNDTKKTSPFIRPDGRWTLEEHHDIVDTLINNGCQYIKGREEYTLLKQVLKPQNLTEVSDSGKNSNPESAGQNGIEDGGVSSTIGYANRANDTTLDLDDLPDATIGSSSRKGCGTKGSQWFLSAIDIQKSGSIADTIPSFKLIQSSYLRLNIGFDTEFQYYDDEAEPYRDVLCLTMSISLGDDIIRYMFLVDPRYQRVSAEGGMIPLKYCISDILTDFKACYVPSLPRVLKSRLSYKEKPWKGHEPFKVLDFKAMKDYIIPVTLICHTGKADISIFRRSKYDIDIMHTLGEIQGGWMNTSKIRFKAEADDNYNYYWIVDLQIRDTLGLTPAEAKSLKALGNVIHRPKIELKSGYIEHMASYAVEDPIGFYEYACNDGDIVVDFVSELFLRNHAVPMTLSSAAASAMKASIKRYLGTPRQADYDRVFRGLELWDDGPTPDKDQVLKFLKATRYVPLQDSPDAKLISEFSEESYVGGFNASFFLGWITDRTTDFDLKNAYPTAMSRIIDLNFSKPVRDFPRDYELALQDIPDPLTPAVAVGDFDFPEGCYCPNIPVPVKGGLNIYPLHGKHVYMTGPDMYLALRLGARIRIFRGFTCHPLHTSTGEPSRCLAHAVTSLVQDRTKAKKLYPDNPLVEKSLKTMVNSGYGKTAQNVSPKTRYNARRESREAAEPSAVTSPYHATYTTALVRCMLIACINELHNMGYTVFSVTTDGFITDAPEDVLRSIDAYGFTEVFKEGRYTLNRTRESIPDNHVWEAKHPNDIFLNVTTRGNVAINDEGVLAHNSYITGEEKGSRADRDAYLIAVLSREGKLKCPTKVWTQFSDIVEKKSDHKVTEIIRELSMDFDYKRVPRMETVRDIPVHYESVDGQFTVDTTIAEFDTRPFKDAEEFLRYRPAKLTENCIKIKKDLERVETKASVSFSGYIGKDLPRKQLLSIIAGYLAGKYSIPVLDGKSQAEIGDTVNAWGLTEKPLTKNDVKNCSRPSRQNSWLPYEYIAEMLEHIKSITHD